MGGSLKEEGQYASEIKEYKTVGNLVRGDPLKEVVFWRDFTR